MTTASSVAGAQQRTASVGGGLWRGGSAAVRRRSETAPRRSASPPPPRQTCPGLPRSARPIRRATHSSASFILPFALVLMQGTSHLSCGRVFAPHESMKLMKIVALDLLALGIGLLVSGRLSARQRRSVGATLLGVGATT